MKIKLKLTPKPNLKLMDQMQGPHVLMAELLYGAGLRLMECVRFLKLQFRFRITLPDGTRETRNAAQ